MCLHGVGQAARATDGRSEQHVVREDNVGRLERAQRLRVRLHVRLALRGREVLQQPCLEPLVLVEHEHRQQSVRQLGHDDARTADVVILRVSFLADDRDVVSSAHPLARERARVDVRTGAAQQVAVPDKDPHGG